MAAQSSSSSFNYDVYLSFRGEDTRFGFTGNLYKGLRDRGIHTFFDDEKLNRGEEITTVLRKAIKESRIAIIVFSPDYASSSFCLDELVYICDLSKVQGLLVVPVFYKVHPSDVRHQRGSYEKAFAAYERRFKHDMDKLQKWKMALRQVADISGFHFDGGYEYKLIGEIIESVSSKINRVPLHVVDYLVGLDKPLLHVMSLLDLESYDVVHMVGIHGIRGIGKTTLAIAVYNRIAYLFDGLCFLENVREISKKQGLQHLQSILLSETVGEKNINIASVKQGISIIQHRLQQKKVLLLLDDVDELKQLEAIAGKPDWFGPGSRIIITTREKQLLSRHGVKRTYEVKGLNKNDALRLLSWKAFGTEIFDASYVDYLNHILTYVPGHPLILEAIGSSLFGKSIKHWEFAVKQIKKIPNDQMPEKLKASFDVFGEEEKSNVELESCSDAFSYDVFLSFRASDTLHGFSGYLYKALHDKGIRTYINDEQLQRGQEIAPEIVKVIEDSRIAITVLSINYASSSFCLDELASILDCLKRKRLLVLPVFYNVDPSHVRHQTGSFGEALAKYKERFKHNKLENWKMALQQVANLSGFHFKHGDRYEYEFIGKIVEHVSSKINRTPLHIAGYPVGIESQVLKVRKLLDVGCDDVLMIGIHGIGGVGKSTLAREVYNLIADHFDASCFIENVREKSKKHGLRHIQSILLSKILGEMDITVTSVQQGTSMIQRRLQQKKVLLILDAVNKKKQLQEVVGRRDWFGPGSKVIITTRHKQLLESHGVDRIYEVEELNKNDALQLLKQKAFKMQYIDPRYEKLLERAVTYASGLPLALEIIGSNLFGKSVEEWEAAIHQFEKSPDDRIQVILKASFDALEEKERSIFLDLACCFKGYELAEIQRILHAHYGHRVKYYIDVLVDKSLVKLSQGTKPYDTITLHDLIEDMGKEIEQQESLTEPSKRRRLWLLNDIREVSVNNTGTSNIEIICLDFPIFDEEEKVEEKVEWDGKAFQNMQNLKTIIIRNCNFSQGPEYLPNTLRVLEWWRYPSHYLPFDFHPKELAICKLPYSHISPTELTDLLKKYKNLRVLEFSSASV